MVRRGDQTFTNGLVSPRALHWAAVSILSLMALETTGTPITDSV